jgi:hypothetical protein
MGFFSFLFRKPVTIDDDFFGWLSREPCDFSASRSCWYAKGVLFAPTGAKVECMIDAGIGGPSLAQRAFFQQFEKDYAAILPRITRMVEADFRLPESITDFALTHRLAGLTIPPITTELLNWELWFEQADTSQWGYTVIVEMLNDVPQPGIGISA